MVRALDFRSKGWWFDAQSLPSCCFLVQGTYPTLTLFTQVYKMGTGNMLLGLMLRWTSIPSRGGVAIHSVVACCRNRDKLRPCGPRWLVCDLTFTLPYLICHLENYKV